LLSEIQVPSSRRAELLLSDVWRTPNHEETNDNIALLAVAPCITLATIQY
jgi:hypothetical protein